MAKWFGSKTDAIGVDLGRSSLKLAQVSMAGGKLRLAAAATIDVPETLRTSSTGPLELFEQTVDRALAANGFRGRRVVLGLPASCMHIDRLRLSPTLTAEQVRQAVTWETVDRLPFHPSRAMLRHFVAGEVYDNQERCSEVIVMAARNELIESLLAGAKRAKLDVVGLVPEPIALIGGIAAAGQTADQSDKAADRPSRAILDIGHGSTRMYIACGKVIQFARSIAIGWSHLDATARSSESEDAEFGAVRMTRSQNGQTGVMNARAGAGIHAESLRRLVQELSLSCHYHAETFPNNPISEGMVVGGVAEQARLCAQFSAVMGVPVRAGDPLSPFGRQTDRAAAGAVQSRPEWAVAIGLSLSAGA